MNPPPPNFTTEEGVSSADLSTLTLKEEKQERGDTQDDAQTETAVSSTGLLEVAAGVAASALDTYLDDGRPVSAGAELVTGDGGMMETKEQDHLVVIEGGTDPGGRGPESVGRESESSESSSSSDSDTDSSTSSSGSEDEEGGAEDGEEGESGDHDDDKRKGVEEGEINDHSEEEEDFILVGSEDEEVLRQGPIKSKNELEVLPHVPPVGVTLEPRHQTLPVGVITSIIGLKVIVDGKMKHDPLDEGSILWITERRTPLGLVDEVFGPVKNPYYVVRYNSDLEVPVDIQVGMTISFVMEFSHRIINEKALHKKGYDASGDNDEELNDEIEFSDDEKEAEYRKVQRQAKRGGVNSQRHGNRDGFNNKKKAQDNSRENRKNTRHQVSNVAAETNNPSRCVLGKLPKPSVTGSHNNGNCMNYFGSSQAFGNGSPAVPSIPHAMQSGDFFHGQQPNLLPQHPAAGLAQGAATYHPQNLELASGLLMNPFSSHQPMDVSHHYHHQQLYPAFPNGASLQQQQQQQQQLLFNHGITANLLFSSGLMNQQQQQQQQFISSFPNGLPFQQQFATDQATAFNSALANGSLPFGLSALAGNNFSQAPSGGNNVSGMGVSGINNNVQNHGLLPPSGMQYNVGPPMQFNLGASPDQGRGPHASRGRRPFG